MYGHESLFLYFSLRAQQEQIAAINAGSAVAADVHQRLSALHATKASLAATAEVASEKRRVGPYTALDSLAVPVPL